MSVCAVVAADPVHEEMSWLNAEADKTYIHISHFLCVPTPNVLVERRSGIKHIYIVVTFSVFQLPMSWLNAEAAQTYHAYSHLRCVPTPNVLVERRSGSNIPYIVSHLRCVPTPNVLVERRSGLKHIFIEVTFSVFQLPMSWLNAEA